MKARRTDGLEAEARGAGAIDVRFERGAKHPKMKFDLDGEPKTLTLTGTSGDRNIDKIEMATLRRLLGVKATAGRTRQKTRHRRRRKAASAPKCPTLTTFPDPFEPLLAVVDRVALDCRCRCGGLDGVLARIERRGIQAAKRVQALADEIIRGSR